MRPTSRLGVQAAPAQGQQEAVTRATFPGLVTRAHSSVPKPCISSMQGTEAATPPTYSLPRATPPGSLLPGEAVGSSWSIMERLELPHPPAQGWGQDKLPAEPGALGTVGSRFRARPGWPSPGEAQALSPALPLPPCAARGHEGRGGTAYDWPQLPLSSTTKPGCNLHADKGRHPAPRPPLGSKCFPLDLTDAATGPLSVPCPLLRGPSLHPCLGNSSWAPIPTL